MRRIINFATLMVIVLLTCVECQKESSTTTINSDNAILSFKLPQQVGETSIDSIFHFITCAVAKGTDLSALTPQITVSKNATIEPASGVTVDFSQGSAVYKVTAEDGSEQDWKVYVSIAKSSEAKILSFTVANQIGNTVITDSTVSVVVAGSVDLTKISPTIVVSPGATVAPGSGIEKNFSHGPVTYVVLAEDNATKQAYKATITKN